ncbi:DUF4349 domain-containing protein [Pontibacter sp. Tf4]|uniref:DUF4349 domain-containing protein n=1 Tax=Pontibacter sp. Tf4 TaxID=2761620 RepID=UPI00162678D5|nr:DUF4349 domain-containing protein [Pontibacter sp. Tf4]MBB6612016.1 DUF4349 domain-containing protein [Pontibacter sp. Tf4]
MKRPAFYFLIAFLSLSLLSCQTGNDAGEAEESSAIQSVLSPDAAMPAPSDRKLIREAHLRFQVKDLSESSTRVEAVAKKYKASIIRSQSNNGEESIEANYTIKVLPENLDELLAGIQAESIFLDNKTVTADDVTLHYTDVEARVKAKQAARARYLELLQQAKKVEDVLAIEVELNKVQEDLESVQAQLIALQQQTSFSTIHLAMYQVVPASYTDRTSFTTRVTSAVSGGWQLFKDLLVGVVYIWPLIIVIIGALFLIRWYKRRPGTIV